MHEFAFNLNQQVRIDINGKTGTVVSQWSSIDGADQFQVEYADDSGCVNRDWFPARSLAAA